MKMLYLLFIFFPLINGKLPDDDKIEFCENLDCDSGVGDEVCGIRYEDEEVKFRKFENECQLLQYGCQVDDSQTYGITSMKYCANTMLSPKPEVVEHVKFVSECPKDCSTVKDDPVCGIRQYGEGFKIRTFNNECQLMKYNCIQDLNFVVTDFFVCEKDEDDNPEHNTVNEMVDEDEPIAISEENVDTKAKMKAVVVVDGSMLDRQHINDSIRDFFAATHILDLPLKDVQPIANETARRMLVRIFGPIQIFRPWVKKPKNISDDYDHKPTLSSCYHKCPTKCPDTYAPVCGVPGIVAREPSLMFQNHCFMDVAQCKMHWEGKSYTAESSAYIESSFLFCLGDELNGLYRFLPLIKTLQHMGRLKNKGHFHYKFKNMRFFNNLLSRQPRIMG